jgi:2-oxoglutarate dehydrogenase E2 component (dihydrolipoamide succinyltransferase)
MAVPVKVPPIGESVKQATLLSWRKKDGDSVAIDEMLCELETDKANTEIPAEVAGIFRHIAEVGQVVNVGDVIAEIDPNGASSANPSAKSAKPADVKKPAGPSAPPTPNSPAPIPASTTKTSTIAPEDYSPAVRRLIAENQLDPKSIPATGPSGRLTKEDVEAYLARSNDKGAGSGNGASGPVATSQATQTQPQTTPWAPPSISVSPQSGRKDIATTAPPSLSQAAMTFDAGGIHRAPMSKIRKRIAQTLVQAQQTAAILTTFNEVDVTAIGELRTRYKERFQEVHGVGLGFMSFFARAAVLALKEFPRINAFIDGDDVVYHQYVNLGIAVSTDRGLAVPVLRHVEKMSFARIESEIKRLANATREGKLSLEELSGGTFTITNGGVFGSLLSTPIINPPQSGILGMHTIQKRPVVLNDKIEIRSMMYVALSYDHRLVDGRESVSFLVRLKQYLEDPARLMLEI